MFTYAGSGVSQNQNTKTAAREAARQALSGLRGHAPLLGFLFSSIRHELGVALTEAETATGAPIVGCTTAGEFTERGPAHGGIVLLLLSSDEMIYDLAMTPGLSGHRPGVARDLCAGFGSLSGRARAAGYGQGLSVVLVDGLSGAGDRFVRDVMAATRPFQQIVGGAAGDDGAFRATFVGLRREALRDAAAAAHIFSKKRVGIGVGHGLRPATEQMNVTKAEGNIVIEINERPAFEAYKKFAAQRGVLLEPKSAGPFLIKHEIGLYFLGELRTARAPLSAKDDGSLLCAAEVASGSTICILDGVPVSMIQAAHSAAQEAKANLGGHPAAAVLVFDCVARGTILGSEFSKEIDAIRHVFPEVPIAGFLTYGEIARCKGRTEGWHNTTAVVAAIPGGS